jgi:hypothetical protein
MAFYAFYALGVLFYAFYAFGFISRNQEPLLKVCCGADTHGQSPEQHAALGTAAGGNRRA